MDWMNYFDVCSSMLFEATADSEADSDINKNMDHALLREEIGLAEDDALSCSCDDTDFKDFVHSSADQEFDLVDEKEQDSSDHFNCFDYFEDDDDDEEEEGTVDQIWNGEPLKKPTGKRGSEGALMAEKQKKLKVCGDSVKEFMNERDKDRIFWETCLAS